MTVISNSWVEQHVLPVFKWKGNKTRSRDGRINLKCLLPHSHCHVFYVPLRCANARNFHYIANYDFWSMLLINQIIKCFVYNCRILKGTHHSMMQSVRNEMTSYHYYWTTMQISVLLIITDSTLFTMLRFVVIQG